MPTIDHARMPSRAARASRGLEMMGSLGRSTLAPSAMIAVAPGPPPDMPPGRGPSGRPASADRGLGRLRRDVLPALRSAVLGGAHRGVSGAPSTARDGSFIPRRPLVIASNRGPVAFELDEEGELVSSRGGGGLVTGLTSALQLTGGLWVASAMSDGDRVMTERSPGGRIEILDEDAKYHVRYLNVPPERFDRYYNVISNRILWFLHHYLFDVARSPRFGQPIARAWEDYVSFNQSFADLLAEEWKEGRDPAYLVQDYHLALVPALLRERVPRGLISHFSHTPFAGPTYFRILPSSIAEATLRGMLGANVLGFQSEDWADNF